MSSDHPFNPNTSLMKELFEVFKHFPIEEKRTNAKRLVYYVLLKGFQRDQVLFDRYCKILETKAAQYNRNPPKVTFSWEGLQTSPALEGEKKFSEIVELTSLDKLGQDLIGRTTFDNKHFLFREPKAHELYLFYPKWKAFLSLSFFLYLMSGEPNEGSILIRKDKNDAFVNNCVSWFDHCYVLNQEQAERHKIFQKEELSQRELDILTDYNKFYPKTQFNAFFMEEGFAETGKLAFGISRFETTSTGGLLYFQLLSTKAIVVSEFRLSLTSPDTCFFLNEVDARWGFQVCLYRPSSGGIKDMTILYQGVREKRMVRYSGVGYCQKIYRGVEPLLPKRMMSDLGNDLRVVEDMPEILKELTNHEEKGIDPEEAYQMIFAEASAIKKGSQIRLKEVEGILRKIGPPLEINDEGISG